MFATVYVGCDYPFPSVISPWQFVLIGFLLNACVLTQPIQPGQVELYGHSLRKKTHEKGCPPAASQGTRTKARAFNKTAIRLVGISGFLFSEAMYI
jgi:hypothetical protein